MAINKFLIILFLSIVLCLLLIIIIVIIIIIIIIIIILTTIILTKVLFPHVYSVSSIKNCQDNFLITKVYLAS